MPLFPDLDSLRRGLICPIPKDGKDGFTARVRACLLAVGAPASLFSGYSFRSGGATDLWSAGVRPRLIQLHGRWKSDAFWLYVRDNFHARAAEIYSAFPAILDSPSVFCL
jgi:hypothetical protein